MFYSESFQQIDIFKWLDVKLVHRIVAIKTYAGANALIPPIYNRIIHIKYEMHLNALINYDIGSTVNSAILLIHRLVFYFWICDRWIWANVYEMRGRAFISCSFPTIIILNRCNSKYFSWKNITDLIDIFAQPLPISLRKPVDPKSNDAEAKTLFFCFWPFRCNEQNGRSTELVLFHST